MSERKETKETKDPRGRKRALSTEELYIIQFLYELGEVSQRELAYQFDVCQATISNVVTSYRSGNLNRLEE